MELTLEFLIPLPHHSHMKALFLL